MTRPSPRTSGARWEWAVVIHSPSKKWAETCAESVIRNLDMFPWDVEVRRVAKKRGRKS